MRAPSARILKETPRTFHQETVKRDIRKALKWFLEHYEESIEGTEAEIVNKTEKVRFKKRT